jgi:uncharacterized LabA/DUF88 family protein
MIIDAMDILYTGRVDGFCIISSDSDFTRLALRLREAGMKIIGMGEKKTPEPFIVSCDKFIYIEILSTPKTKVVTNKKEKAAETVPEAEAEPTELIKKVDSDIITLIATSITDMADEGGWAFLGEVGNHIIKKQPDFDPRNFGYKKLALLLKSTGAFELDERLTDKGNGNIKHVYVKVITTPKPEKVEKVKKASKAANKSKKGTTKAAATPPAS